MLLLFQLFHFVSYLKIQINILHLSRFPGLFWRIHQMDFSSYFIYFIIGTVLSTYFLKLAYQNMKFILKHKLVFPLIFERQELEIYFSRIAQKREEAVHREISKIFANDKNSNKKDKDDR
jgi:translocon-associated protein subunit gamma